MPAIGLTAPYFNPLACDDCPTTPAGYDARLTDCRSVHRLISTIQHDGDGLNDGIESTSWVWNRL
jgi:hypothetical protein